MHLARAPFLLALALLLMPATNPDADAQGRPDPSKAIGFLERFALAEDRAEALKELIPGTEDYYYFHALHAQQTGDAQGFKETIEAWAKRQQNNGRRENLLLRQAFLDYEKDPEGSLKKIADALNLHFNHSRENRATPPNLPTALDPKLVTDAAFLERARKANKELGQVTDAGLEILLRDEKLLASLSTAELRALLGRIQRPDFPLLVGAVLRELGIKDSPGFGGYAIHRQLTADQLDELARKKPDLLRNQNFVYTRLARFLPGADESLERQPDVRRRYLAAAWAFAEKLEPSFNDLKALLLHQRLAFARDHENEFPKDLFLEYLKLPRNSPVILPDYLRSDQNLQRFAANLGSAIPGCPFPAIGDERQLLRDYLGHYFRTEDSIKPYDKYLKDTFLKPLLAETRILHGDRDVERWASLLSPSAFQALKERVEIRFAATNPKEHALADKVSLEVDLKNVENLIVKVYEIDTLGFYNATGREVNTDLELDGLVANSEKTFTYEQPALRRHRETFAFPEIGEQRGVWIVEFIGNSQSSRAVIRKGDLQPVVRPSTAGSSITVIDENHEIVKNASIWFAGRRYQPDPKAKSAEITIPFNSSGAGQMILTAGPGANAFATLAPFQAPAENYELHARFHLERESLLTRNTARLLVRPSLTANGLPTNLALLKKAILHVTAIDLEGTETTETVEPFALYPDRESVYEFSVPERFAYLNASLTGEVELLTGQTVQVAAQPFQASANTIAEHAATADLHLSRDEKGHFLELLGRNGEPLGDRAVQLSIRGEVTVQTHNHTHKTDARGRIRLGDLSAVQQLIAHSEGLATARALAPGDLDPHNTLPQSLHLPAGQPLRLPYATNTKPDRHELALLEVRGNAFAADHFAKLKIEGGFLTAADLAPGDYRLVIKSDAGARSIPVRVTEPVATVQNLALGEVRSLELLDQRPLQITAVERGGKAVTVRLANVKPTTRVQVAATRYLGGPGIFDRLRGLPRYQPLVGTPGHRPNLYLTGRRIGDEYRYVIDRKYAAKFPGILAPRPGLLLNPWALRDTETSKQDAKEGTEWAKSREPQAAPGQERAKAKAEMQPEDDNVGGVHVAHDLNFLANPAPIFVNLSPGDDGKVTIPLEELGDRHVVHILAADHDDLAYRSLVLSEPERLLHRDTRLRNGLDPEKEFTQQQQISTLTKGKKILVPDLLTARFKSYDSLADLYQLYRTLSGDPKLDTFDFLLRWPGMEAEEKRALYSEHACHELSFFLSQRDPEFFEEVVEPYLHNKKDKTFLDEYLLGLDLSSYLKPYHFQRLNTVERALLVRRIDGRRGDGARHLRDLDSLSRPSPAHLKHLFETAVRSSSLGGGDEEIETVANELRKLSEEEVLREAAAKEAAPPAPAAAPAMAMDMLKAQKKPAARGLMSKGRATGRSAQIAGAVLELAEAEEQDKALADHFGFAGKAIGGGGAALGAMDADGIVAGEALGIATGGIADARFQTLSRRKRVREFFRKLGQTKEWAENNYHHLPIEQQLAGLIGPNALWRDFAAWDGKGVFLSPHVAEAARNFPEMMFALAVIGLPYEGGEHETEVGDDGFSLTAASPAIVFHEEIKLAPEAGDEDGPGATILVAQHFVRMGEEHVQVDGQPVPKYVTDEFLKGVVYTCNLVLSNPGAQPQEIDVITQIPHGAIAVSGSRPTDSRTIQLSPYQAQEHRFHFYFPESGDFDHYPVHASREGFVLAGAEPFTFHVVDELTQVDKASWDYISQFGEEAEVFAYLDANNLHDTNLARVAWRCRESKAFTQKLCGLLADRHAYDGTVFSYGIKHGIQGVAEQFLLHQEGLLDRVGPTLECALLTIDPVERHRYQHLEYSPLVNARAHVLGGARTILNPNLHRQHHALMNVLAHRAELDGTDAMAVVYSLFLQDRYEEGLRWFGKVKPDQLATRLQYDYFATIAAMLQMDVAKARGIADQYTEYPVDKWRVRFAEARAHLDGADGAAEAEADPDAGDGEAREQRQNELASTEPSFDLEVDNRGQVDLTYANLETVSVALYEMDLEFLFSSNPFVSGGDTSRFSIIKPNHTMELKLAKNKKAHRFPLPGAFQKKNVLVRVTGAGKQKSVASYANELDVEIAANYGRLQVRHAKTEKPLVKTYIKVYAQTPQGPRFYKDGYTDLRGKFDYASLNTDDLGQITRLAILVMHDEHGAVVKDVAPPKE